MTTTEDLLVGADNTVSGIARLYLWSLNWEAGRGPFALFLDLIGWSDDRYGMNLYGNTYVEGLGYMELDYLAKALSDYALNPGHARDYIDKLMEAEDEEPD